MVSHHAKLSIIVTVQHLFQKTNFGRPMCVNSTHMTIFQNRADSLSLRHISMNIFRDARFLHDAMDWVIENLGEGRKPDDEIVKYIIIDSHPASLPNRYRTVTNIFPMKNEGNIIRPIFLFMKQQ